MLRDDVVDTWKLKSYTVRDGLTGSLAHPFGDDATGLPIASADGYMSVQLMRADRPLFDRPDTDGGHGTLEGNPADADRHVDGCRRRSNRGEPGLDAHTT